MDSKHIGWNARFTREVVRHGLLRGDEFALIEIRAGTAIPRRWVVLEDQLRATCIPSQDIETLSLKSPEWEKEGEASGQGRSRWFGRIGTRRATEPHVSEPSMVGTTLSDIVKARGLPTPQFLAICAEGDEFQILRGSEAFLGRDGVLGVEIQVSFAANRDRVPIADVCGYLGQQGYFLVDLSVCRKLRWARASAVANPDDLTRGDALFLRDLIVDGFQVPAGDRSAQLRIIKAAVTFEIYNMPDRAAELLLHYRDPLSDLLNLDQYLDQLVPCRYGLRPAYDEYLGGYPSVAGLDWHPVPRRIVAVDLAGGQPISSGGNSVGPERAFDGDSESFWVSAERGAAVKRGAWLGYEFAEPQKLCSLRLVQTTNRPFRQDRITVEASTDGGLTWQPVLTPPVNLFGAAVSIVDLPPEAPEARLWRVLAASDNAQEPEHAWTVYEVTFFVGRAGGMGPRYTLIELDGEAIAGGMEPSNPERAFDGDPESFWLSGERGTGVKGIAWIGYSFAQPREVRRIKITQTAHPAFRQDLVRVEKRIDRGMRWVPAAPGPFRSNRAVSWIDLPAGEPAGAWRIVAAGDNAVEPEHAWSVYEIAWFSAREDQPTN